MRGPRINRLRNLEDGRGRVRKRTRSRGHTRCVHGSGENARDKPPDVVAGWMGRAADYLGGGGPPWK